MLEGVHVRSGGLWKEMIRRVFHWRRLYVHYEKGMHCCGESLRDVKFIFGRNWTLSGGDGNAKYLDRHVFTKAFGAIMVGGSFSASYVDSGCVFSGTEQRVQVHDRDNRSVLKSDQSRVCF